MRILFTVFHPDNPQIVKFVAKILSKNGHNIKFAIFEKENIIQSIIESYGYDFQVVGVLKNDSFNKFKNVPNLLLNLNKIVESYKPDIIFSPSSPLSGIISKINKIPLIAWADTEIASINLKFSLPFISSLILANTFYYPIKSKKIIRISGYKEIAHLHPTWFKMIIQY